MEELIFFAVVIFLSVIESIARSRKAKKAGGGLEKPPSDAQGGKSYDFEWAQRSPDELPTYDAEPSYDDAVEAPEPEPAPKSEARPSSETLLSGRLLEELAGIAGRVEQERQRMLEAETREKEEARREAEAASGGADRSAGEWAADEWAAEQRRRREARKAGETGRLPVPRPPEIPDRGWRGHARPLPSHSVHRAHAGYGTDPSSRARSEQDGMDPLAERLSSDARAARSQLRGAGRAALRQAIILQEVLGPPVALRPDSFEDR